MGMCPAPTSTMQKPHKNKALSICTAHLEKCDHTCICPAWRNTTALSLFSTLALPFKSLVLPSLPANSVLWTQPPPTTMNKQLCCLYIAFSAGLSTLLTLNIFSARNPGTGYPSLEGLQAVHWALGVLKGLPYDSWLHIWLPRLAPAVSDQVRFLPPLTPFSLPSDTLPAVLYLEVDQSTSAHNLSSLQACLSPA